MPKRGSAPQLKEAPLLVWLLGFRVVRLTLALLGWILVLALLVVWLRGAGQPILLATVGYALGSLLSIGLWLWYRGWWHLGDAALRRLLKLTPRQFEDAVGDLLSALGYRDVKVVGGPGDLGADVLCRDEEDRLVAVQCKHYAPGHNVDSETIQLFLGALHIHAAERGIIATTSAYTQPARALADKQGIRLIDGPELSRLFQATCVLSV